MAVQAAARAGRHRDRRSNATNRTTTEWCWQARKPLYVEAFPMTEYSMYGAVPLKTIKQALLTPRPTPARAGQVLDLTNCTFDGHIYTPAG